MSLPFGKSDQPVEASVQTGSIIARESRPLAPEFGAEDWRRARSALAVAVDPQGNGSPVTWDNPESGLKGSFQPIASPFVKGDEICRSFVASYSGGGAGPTWLQGSACRPSGGEWSIGDVKPWKKPG